MKKCILFVLFLGIQFVNGQSYWIQQGNNIYYNSGNVSIGTGAIAPATALSFGGLNESISVATEDGTDNGRISIVGGGALSINRGSYLVLHGNEYPSDAGSVWLSSGKVSGSYIDFRPKGNSRMRITENGRVGIGIQDPTEKLHVSNGNIYIDETYWIGKNPNNNLCVTGGSLISINSGNSMLFNIDADGGESGKFFGFYTDGANGGGTELVRITEDGKMGIGTNNPDAYTLAVKGTIGAQEIEVVQTIPDYVFEEDYNLRPLEEVEQCIKSQGHLPDIPSAKEFEGGRVAIGEMQEKHLQKIEELTLYIIEQNKKMQQLEERLEKLEGKE